MNQPDKSSPKRTGYPLTGPVAHGRKGTGGQEPVPGKGYPVLGRRPHITVMEQEAGQAADMVTKQLQTNQPIIQSLAKKLRNNPPPFVMTIGRGSSDHACSYAKYLLESFFGWATASAAPSISTIYHTPLQLKNALVIAVSQSGKSPDICGMMEMAKWSGAVTVAIVNRTDSPLAELADYVLPMLAGEETAVAATKSHMGSLTTLAQLAVAISENSALSDILQQLPDTLNAAYHMDWQFAVDTMQHIEETLVLARGYGFAIAHEAALKFKETCSIHAEAFSGAEVLHGPIAILKRQNPYLCFLQNDESLPSMLELARKIEAMGGQPIMALAKNIAQQYHTESLPLPDSLHPAFDPIVTIQAFYPMVAQLSIRRGRNPDAPEHLKKVTETV